MSTVKRVSGNYTIQSINPTDSVNIDSSMVIINGNLVVTGNSQSITSTDTAITDHSITLNNGVTQPNPLGANIIVARGPFDANISGSGPVSLRWLELGTKSTWQMSTFNSVTQIWGWSNIATAQSVGIASVSADPDPTLSANLNLAGSQVYDSTTGVSLYTGVVSGGGTGVYVNNGTYNSVELATKSKAIAYSIVFG
jgi:hypothetical protein